jgi:hypothetical protein
MIADRYGTHMTFIYGGAVVLLATVVLALTRLPRTLNQVAADEA